MPAALDTFTADGRVVISFPESAISSADREDFIAMLKTEWALRQSNFTETDARSLAEEVDSAWWARNRSRILDAIGAA